MMADLIVSYQWLDEHLDDPNLVILDTRPKIAYMYGHIPNSVQLAVDQIIKISEHGAHLAPDADAAAAVFGSLGIDGTKTVIVTGEAMDPSLARVAWTLQYFGHGNTKMLNVGIGTWQSLGLKMTRAQKPPVPTEFVPKIIPEMRIESDELQRLLGKVTVIDARSPQEFFGGHLPGSILIPFTDGLGQSGTVFEPEESLQKMFAEKQVANDKEIVCYCMHGHRASSLFYQLKLAGLEKVRLYDGSFIDWYSKRLALE
ncbi:sulfurtransferase [Candidatus Nitrosotenuis cloacae]|uniref:sulfurtransferase n=1 Tax=Candidatus Nitrosotenuis cloacae TaxID=1603555 RepID=UPI002282FCE5|nr:rhodanese-like domain-containing protein [Candidatus Nitrosotenuis cloacae]